MRRLPRICKKLTLFKGQVCPRRKVPGVFKIADANTEGAEE